MSKSVVVFSDVTLRLRDKLIFPHTKWEIKEDEHWAVLGPNGSGKSTFVRSLWGGTPLSKGQIILDLYNDRPRSHPVSQKDAIGYVSFELHQYLMEQEQFQEDVREYSGKTDDATTVEDIICRRIADRQQIPPSARENLNRVVHQLDIDHLVQRNITSLSTGEMRKVLIARALMKSPKLLILDEPFDGLDESSRTSLGKCIDAIMTDSMRVILVTHRLEEVLPRISHALLVKNGRLWLQGPKDTILTSENMESLYDWPIQVIRNSGKFATCYDSNRKHLDTGRLYMASGQESPDPLIEMKDVVVSYARQQVLDRVNWTVRRGENWAILGPNGAGKSTLLKLITGDHMQAYTNHVVVFGKQRDSGESIWQNKERIGMISDDLQARYRKNINVREIIASGFFDSIGLYRRPTSEQMCVVEQWVELLGIEDLAGQNYHHLSYGQKRLALLARAMVKSPILLILDEPCHGLDVANRGRILNVIEAIGRKHAHLLFVTHHMEELPASVTHVMRLEQGKAVRQYKR